MTEGTAIRTRGLFKDDCQGNGVSDLDLEVEHGEILGFLDPNGAGKSTTMRLLLDLIRPTAGAATVLGLDSRGDSLEMPSASSPCLATAGVGGVLGGVDTVVDDVDPLRLDRRVAAENVLARAARDRDHRVGRLQSGLLASTTGA